MKHLLNSIVFVFTFISIAFPQSGTIKGHITESKYKNNLAEVIVKLQDNNNSCLSNNSGNYNIPNIAYGTYYVVFSKKDYYSLVIPDVKVNSSNPVELDVEMVPGDEKEYLFLEIGGIQVTANRELLSEEVETVHSISSGEIEHMQANSLANVLSLIPGNVQTEAPGLQSKQDISIRGFNDPGELFGTKIVIDDIPLSNNANLQTGVGVNYGSSVQSTVNTQFDLREVVAENLEKVEVQSGATSVEFGDNSQGIIVAETKVTNVPTRIKIRNNPDTQEGNLMGSFSGFNTNFVYNLNYGYSERDIRVSGDEYHRIAADLKAKNTFGKDLELLQIFKYGRKIEEDDDDSDPEGTKAYNRDYNLTYSHQIDYQADELTSLYIRNFINFRRRNSWKRKLETPDLAIWTNRLTPGTIEGITPESATYYSDVKTIGQEWSYGSKLKIERNALLGNTLHRWMLGAEFQTDDNNGPGKSYDLLKPPGGKTSSRPRSFDDTPGTVQLSLFASDRITGDFLLPYTLDFGFRIDSYNPTGLKLKNLFENHDVFLSDQGTFFNPRIGIKLKVASKSQIRFSFSKSSKSPPISSIYPENFYLDVLDLGYKTVTDTNGNQYIKQIDLISTYAYNNSALKLKGYQSTKYELSYDQQVWDFGMSLSGFYQYTNGIPVSIDIPFEYNRYGWPSWPDTSGKFIIENILLTDSKYDVAKNLGKTESSGLEFELTSHRIKPLNMIFRVNGSFTFKKYSSEFYRSYGNTEKIAWGDTLPNGNIASEETKLIPYYKPSGDWRQRAVINYNINYIAKSLGIWLTFKAQHVLLEQSLSSLVEDLFWENKVAKTAAVGYYMDGEHYTINRETAIKYGFIREYEETSITADKKPNNQWMFSLVASKSLFKGAEVSLFVENILNDLAYYVDRTGYYRSRNYEIHWGIAFSSKIDDFFK